MFDLVLIANTIKDVPPEAISGSAPIPGLLGECRAVVSQDGMDLGKRTVNPSCVLSSGFQLQS